MIAQLGSVQFEIDKLNYQSLSRSLTYDWQEQKVANSNPNLQITGHSQTISLNGIFYPHHFGGLAQIDALEEEAKKQEPLQLTIIHQSNRGRNLGFFVIKNLNIKEGNYIVGVPQKIDFSLSLSYYGEVSN